jgi:hypothetical protein
MSMVTVGISATVLGAGATVASGISNSRNSKKALAAQKTQAGQAYGLQKSWMDYFREAIGAFSEQAFELAGESKQEVKDSWRRNIGTINTFNQRGNRIINDIPEITELMDEAEGLSRRDFDFRTGLKRENLDFILGDNQQALRDSQTLNTNISSLNSADFQGRFSDIVRSSMFGLKASTIGDPYGTFSNLSARNLYDFAQQGLSNSLAINDFFSREGTVDPISPLQTSFDLRNVAEREAGMRIGVEQFTASSKVQNEQWRANSIGNINSGLIGGLGQALGATGNAAQMGIGLESNNLANMSNISNAGLMADQARMQSYINAAGMLTSGIGQAYGLQTQRMAVDNQNQLNNALINQYTNQAASSRYGQPVRNV